MTEEEPHLLSLPVKMEDGRPLSYPVDQQSAEVESNECWPVKMEDGRPLSSPVEQQVEKVEEKHWGSLL